MKLIKLIVLNLILTLICCKHKQIEKITDKRYFEIPVVQQVAIKDTMACFNVDFLDGVWFKFCGKFKFTDTLKLGEKIEFDTTFKKDYLFEYPTREESEEFEKLNSDGFQLFVDYKTTIYQKNKYDKGNSYFPVYLVNETSHTKGFVGKDNYVFGIQEAIDTCRWGEWRPIESVGFDFCGNGTFWLKVKPGEFVLFLVPKYQGDQTQQMRLRVKVDKTIYFSLPYRGNFNYKQFILKDSTFNYDILNRYGAYELQYLFYGAVPKGYDPPYLQ